MSLKWSGVVAIFTVVISVLAFTFWRGARPIRDSHVFINETSDHRFDESIEVSILAAKNRTGVQNAVVITDRFDAKTLEADAAQLFKKLGLGEATKGRAILYLFSPKTKSLKIEVGYALEGVMPDVMVHQFEQAAKGFTFVDRYQDFWAELINTVNIEIYEQEHGLSQPQLSTGNQEAAASFRFLSGGAGLVAHDYTANVDDLAKQMKPLRGTNFDGGTDVKTSLASYLNSLEQGVGAEKIGVLSRTSRFFRTFTPMTEAQLMRNWKMYEKAGVDKIYREGGFAYVFFAQQHPVLPIVFVYEDGVWKADEPRSWVLFQRFEDSQGVFLKYPLKITNSEFRAYIDARFRKPLYEMPTIDASNYIHDANSSAYLNYYWLERAAIDVRGSGEEQLWMQLDIDNNLGRFHEFLNVLRRLSALHPENKRLDDDLKYYSKLYQFDGSGWIHHLTWSDP